MGHNGARQGETMSELLSQMPLQLEDDLVLRFATTADADAVGAFNTEHHDDNKEHGIVGRGVHHLVSGKHPTIRAEGFTVVEHAPTGRIVSSMCLLSQTWSYGGVEFPVGQPEFVATDKEYRRRGLVRKQFDVLHELSASRGELMLNLSVWPGKKAGIGGTVLVPRSIAVAGAGPWAGARPMRLA